MGLRGKREGFVKRCQFSIPSGTEDSAGLQRRFGPGLHARIEQQGEAARESCDRLSDASILTISLHTESFLLSNRYLVLMRTLGFV